MRTVLVVVLALLVVAFSVPALAAPPDMAIKVLSNRADLISGNDALIEVVLPPDVNPAEVRVSVNGAPAAGSFGTSIDGRFIGLVEGLASGDNVVEAFVDPASTAPRRPRARITITNHSIGGPVFAGAQLQPWICARLVPTPMLVTVPATGPGTVPLNANVSGRVSGLASDPIDEQCNAAPLLTYFYQPKDREGTACVFATTGANRCFEPYNLASPPAEDGIANFTNDRGDTVKSIVVIERGAINRAIYTLITFFDPTKTSTPWAPQRGWNGKLLWNFGASSGASRFQSPPASSISIPMALQRGYMVASSSLTDHGTNANDTLAAETMMMVKEQIAENYGPIRFTLGQGCSGGSIMQQNIAAAYPGLLNGIQPSCSFPDTLTTGIEVTECGLTTGRYFTTPGGVALGSVKQSAINGHNNTGFCATWVGSFLSSLNPSLASTCGGQNGGFPQALVYDAVLRPNGIRCTTIDHDSSMLGTFIDADGNRKGNAPFDNEGIQYGLKALASGAISSEEFVALNEGIGSFTADFGWTGTDAGPVKRRKTASTATLNTVYTAGIVSDGRQLAKAAIIDYRGNQTAGGDIHANWRAWETRDRLDRANGHHDNQLIWAIVGAGGGTAQPGAALALKGLLTLDAWMTNIENDTSSLPYVEKVRTNKPAGAQDMCLTNNGATDAQIAGAVGLDSPTCPHRFQGSPRQVAGGPLAEDVFKCQLKPLDFASADYNGKTFDAGQQVRLAAVFPTGVCDWSKPGVGQQPSAGGTTFAAGPGGQPFGDAPVSMAVNQAPDAFCKNVTVTASAANCTAPASVNNGSRDPDGDPVTLAQSPAGPYGLGATGVTLTVSDDRGLSSSCMGTVVVEDKTAPVITGLTASPNSLWPANHKMVAVSVTPSVADACGATTCRIVSIGVNQAADPSDWQITSPLGASLRAERLGSEGDRVYSLNVQCTDGSGNSAQQTVAVTVPHDLGKK